MNISLLHPSRGRSGKAFKTYMDWFGNASGDYYVEHILSLDTDDKDLDEYKRLFNSYLLLPNTCVVEATNHAAKFSTGDILIYLSDDFCCPVNWDILIINYFKETENPMLLKVDDGLQGFNVPVLTIPIMNMALYERLGYFWHPEYKSMFVDQHLFEITKKNGWIKYAPELIFEHFHPANGKAPNDETYIRSAANWDQGKKLFAKHLSEGFTL